MAHSGFRAFPLPGSSKSAPTRTESLGASRLCQHGSSRKAAPTRTESLGAKWAESAGQQQEAITHPHREPRGQMG